MHLFYVGYEHMSECRCRDKIANDFQSQAVSVGGFCDQESSCLTFYQWVIFVFFNENIILNLNRYL